MNFTRQERETLTKHVSELAGEQLQFDDACAWLRNDCGLMMEHYAGLLAKYPALPAQFIIDQEMQRHNLALDNEGRDKQTRTLQNNQRKIAIHKHTFWTGTAVILHATPYGPYASPLTKELEGI